MAGVALSLRVMNIFSQSQATIFVCFVFFFLSKPIFTKPSLRGLLDKSADSQPLRLSPLYAQVREPRSACGRSVSSSLGAPFFFQHLLDDRFDINEIFTKRAINT